MASEHVLSAKKKCGSTKHPQSKYNCYFNQYVFDYKETEEPESTSKAENNAFDSDMLSTPFYDQIKTVTIFINDNMITDTIFITTEQFCTLTMKLVNGSNL